jgi:Nucleoside-diphosphate-sugar pyrophosphorylase involved in lipopolysaccharide biosynthesis/translation initiation factor 2B, gamma/epsilon subunits (eIF-2Bgamma/eIF-2Bepsilon)
MKALFLAGGRGTRLQPLTDRIPKPMVQIMNRPLLERTMIRLKDSGISEIVISSCYKSRYIKDYFGDGSQLGLMIQYIVEDLPLGTGGAIKNAEALFVYYGAADKYIALAKIGIDELLDELTKFLVKDQ